MEPNLRSNVTNNYNYDDQFLDRLVVNREASMMRNAVLQRQLEKERIREEIIAEEILRRRELEMEVRRELAMEREFARRHAEALSNSPGVGSGIVGRSPVLPAHTQVGNSGNSPFQRPAMPLPTPTPTFANLGSGHAGKVVFMAKPTTSPNISGTNAKVYTVGDKKFIVTGTKKKPKEWGCALCKVSASSEQSLNDHLQGKKHLENAAELKANKSAKKQSSSSSLSGKKTYGTTTDKRNMGDPKSKQGKNQWYCSLCQVSTTCKRGLNDHFQGKGHKAKEAEQVANKTTCDRTKRSNFWCQACNVTCTSEIDLACHQKGKSHRAKEAEPIANITTENPVKSYTTWQRKTDKQETKPMTEDVDEDLSDFWCRDCNVCCSSEINLSGHQKGKKHMARLEALNQNFATVDCLGTSDTGEKGEVSEVTKSETTENVGGKLHFIKKVEEETTKALNPTEALNNKPDESEKSNRFPSLELAEKLKEPGPEDFKKKFIFWCEDCQLGLHCESAIASHLKGKKHMARLQAQKKVVATEPFNTNHNIGTNKTGDDSIERHEKTIGIMDGGVNVVDEAEKGVKVSNYVVKNEPGGEATKALGNKTDEAFNTTPSSQVTSLEQEEKKEDKLPIEAMKEKFIFWCEDCQLGLHCESAIDSHLKGKKHMARLRAQKKVAATDTTSSSHEDSTSKTGYGSIGTYNKAIEIAGREANVAGEAEEGVKVLDSTVNKMSGEATRTLGSKTDETVKGATSSQVPSLEQEEHKEEKLTIEDLKKKFKFWCEDCQIGCHSIVVMVGHLKGKKHMARLQAQKEQCATNGGNSGKEDGSEERFEEALNDFDREQ